MAWGVLEIVIARQLFLPRDAQEGAAPFLVLWLAIWSTGGVLLFSTLVWHLVGREVLLVNARKWILRAEAFGLGSTRAYHARAVKNLRTLPCRPRSPLDGTLPLPPVLGGSDGPVAFDYGMRIVRFAPSLDEVEAGRLVRALQDA